MEYKKMNMGTYNLHLVKTDKFKMCHVEVIFRNNFDGNSMTKRRFLTKLLCESSNKYPSRRKILLEFENLYNATIYSITSRVGDSFVTNFCADFLNPIYTEKNMPKETIRMLFEMILNPYASTNEFDNRTFEIVKNRLIDSINSVKELPSKLAFNNAIKLLENTPASCPVIGSLDELEEITPENLYDYYLNMINNDYVDIFVVGNLDMDEISEYIKDYAKFKIIKNHEVNMHISVPKMKEKVVKEKIVGLQTNVVMILNLRDLDDYERNYVANIYNIILGGGSLQTKLYKKLRAENSLCYSVSSYYQKYDGLICITTGVDVNSGEKAIKLIKEAIKEMSNNISQEELENAKKLIITSLNSIYDSIDRITNNTYFKDLGEIDSVEERIKIFKDVSVDDIYKLNKKINLCVTYSLEGGNE